MSPAADLSRSPRHDAAWQRLEALARAERPPLRELLQDPGRTGRLSLQAAGLTLDYSRQRVDETVLQGLADLAREANLPQRIQDLFEGRPINLTEGRAALHMALRGATDREGPWGQAIDAEVRAERERFLSFADEVHHGRITGSDARPIRAVVNLGIGGSDLGSRMAVRALAAFATGAARVHHVSNPDAWALHEVLRDLDPRTTLFILQSKTFTTEETLTLAESARCWLLDAGIGSDGLENHFCAVTASEARATAWGVPAERCFRLWDWVGGRYSLWSAIGLPLAIAIGAPAFRELLAGARAMDEHFRLAPIGENLPLLMGLLGIWNRNFLGFPSLLVSAYSSPLALLTPHLQQLDMESNGKSVHRDGRPAEIATGPILWGGLGIDGQHAYFQLVHQGQHVVPVDFVAVRHAPSPLPLDEAHARVVRTNLLAQARALALGRTPEETAAALRAEGLPEEEVARLATHRSFRGNVPSSILWLEALTPHSLGALIALHEHKVFTQAMIWNINPFDQWGVELGKAMVREEVRKMAAGETS